MGRQFSTAMWIALVAIASLLALQAANASGIAWSPSETSLTILGTTFIFLMIAMAVVSVGDRMRLSLQLMAIYFTIYLLLPGYNHASANRFPFFNFSYPPFVRVSAAWMIALFLLTVFLGYIGAGRSARAGRNATPLLELRRNVALGLGLTGVSIVSLAVFLSVVGLSGAFEIRSATSTNTLDTASTGLLTALPRVLTFLPVVYGMLAVAQSPHRAFGFKLLAINMPILLIVNFPLAIPRSQLFGYLLLFSLILADFKKPSRRGLLSLAFVFGALVAMPVLDHFTRQQGTFSSLDPQRLSSNYFATGDFDGFQSVNNAVVYVERFGVEYGLQLLSAILFFIPRAIWSSKAEPTGTITSESAGYTFTNVSQPLPSELFVDFGWAGVIGGGLLLGFVFYRFDRWIDEGWVTNPRTRLAAGWLVGFGLPVYRGTLLGVLPPFLILAAGIWLIAKWGVGPAGAAASPDPETSLRGGES